MKDKKTDEENIVEKMSESISVPEDIDYDELLTEALVEKYLNQENRNEETWSYPDIFELK